MTNLHHNNSTSVAVDFRSKQWSRRLLSTQASYNSLRRIRQVLLVLANNNR